MPAGGLPVPRRLAMSRWRRFLVLSTVAVTGLGLAGCSSASRDAQRTTTTSAATSTSTSAGSTTSSTGSATSSTTTGASGPTQVSVYFISAEKLTAAHRTVGPTPQVGSAAVTALLSGPTQAEAQAGLATSIPAGTKLLGLDVSAGLATVDLSSDYQSGGGSTSMRDRLAQVVFTLTQFPTVQQVRFELDGKPVTVFGGEGIVMNHPVGRADYEDVEPAIMVESPAVFDSVSSPARVQGTANVYEGRFHVQIVDYQGRVVADQAVTASSGPARGGPSRCRCPSPPIATARAPSWSTRCRPRT